MDRKLKRRREMIKKNLKVLIASSLIILIPILVGIFLYDKLPEEVPIHWNFEGEVDQYAGKALAVFGMPLILLAFQWFTVLIVSFDPKRKNQSDKLVALSFWIIPAISIMLGAITYTTATGKNISVETIALVFLGFLFAILGNYMPKCKFNYTVGIKLPWTLNSEENWNRTHRMAGKVWMPCGIICIIAGFLNITWLFIASAALMIAIPAVYSFILYKKGL